MMRLDEVGVKKGRKGGGCFGIWTVIVSLEDIEGQLSSTELTKYLR